MEDLLLKVDSFIVVLVAILVAVQAVVNYILPAEKAVKFNVIGKVLDFLAKTRSGISAKIDDGNSK